jgi:predicted PurR-regulated permease PerM
MGLDRRAGADTERFQLGAEALAELPRAASSLAAGYEEIAAKWPKAGSFRGFIAENLPPPAEIYKALGGMAPDEVARGAVGTTIDILGILGSALAVLALSIYWGANRDAFERVWLSLLPVARRLRARTVWNETRAAAGAHMRHELGQSALAATALALGFWAMGCEYWSLPAVAVAVLRLVPLLGGPFAIAAAFLGGLATSVPLAFAAGGLALVVLLMLRLVIAPRVFQAPRLNPILEVMVVLAVARTYGFGALIFAPLITAVIQTLFIELTTRTAAQPDASLDVLEQRAHALEANASAALTPELSNLLGRLRRLLTAAGTTTAP